MTVFDDTMSWLSEVFVDVRVVPILLHARSFTWNTKDPGAALLLYGVKKEFFHAVARAPLAKLREALRGTWDVTWRYYEHDCAGINFKRVEAEQVFYIDRLGHLIGDLKSFGFSPMAIKRDVRGRPIRPPPKK
jgi:hypothetical protein